MLSQRLQASGGLRVGMNVIREGHGKRSRGVDFSAVQGFFDVPVDNLYGRPLLKRYIQTHIPNYKDAVIISPDAGGAKRATAIADSMGIDFALIHKVISPPCPPPSLRTYQPSRFYSQNRSAARPRSQTGRTQA